MAAIPFVIFDADDAPEVNRGDLIKIAAEFWEKSQLEFYRKARKGWSVCPLGYNCYSSIDSLGRKIAFPGIVFPEIDQKRKKFPGHNLKFSKETIEEYVKPHFERAADIREQRDLLFRNLTHDLRAISTEIYNHALVARNGAERRRDTRLIKSLRSVLAAQQMMSVRLDIVDYESGQAIAKGPTAVPVFRKLEKVVLCFRRKISSAGMHYRFQGNSYAETFGPDILEIAFFVLIENAIKYGPKGKQINIFIEEQQGQIFVRVQSWGPCIASNERSRIFERGFRGNAAQRFGKGSGAGIGLFACKSIIEGQFKGNLSVNQTTDRIIVDGKSFYITEFTVSLPIIKGDETPPVPRVTVSQRRRGRALSSG